MLNIPVSASSPFERKKNQLTYSIVNHGNVNSSKETGIHSNDSNYEPLQ